MTVRMDCPHCGAACGVAEEHAGRPVQCYRCKQVFTARSREQQEPLLPDFDAAPAAEGPRRLEVGCASSPGRVRERNEDAYLVQQLSWLARGTAREATLLLVADGMGGHQAGDRASEIVVQTLGAALSPLLAAALAGQTPGSEGPALKAALDRALREANRAVHRLAASDPACKGMGATAAAVLVRDGQALIAHVGDCRVYHRSAGRLRQVTKDQTLVARMVELGQLTAEKALTHPARNEVTQAIGRRADIEPAHYQVELARGDWLVVACDGLGAHVNAALLEGVLNEPISSARSLAQQLVELADDMGGSDNCTVVAACCY